MKLVDPYYRTRAWEELRRVALKRDRYTCVVPGCGQRAIAVDHIVSRKDGGPDVISNMRSLCRRHDNQIKEGPDGKRKSGGKLRAIGCDAQGRPRDPSHWWNT